MNLKEQYYELLATAKITHDVREEVCKVIKRVRKIGKMKHKSKLCELEQWFIDEDSKDLSELSEFTLTCVEDETADEEIGDMFGHLCSGGRP